MITNNIKYNKQQQQGSGLLTRDRYVYPPSFRKLLKQVGDEKITDIKVYRYPLTSLTNIANFFTGNKVPYDDLMHLGIRVNNSYNLDKDSNLSFKKEGLKSNKKGFEMIELRQPSNSMTIKEMLDKTKDRIGNNDFFVYDPFTTNCQNFTMNILKTLGLYSGNVKDFVYQDLGELKEKLPSITDNVTGAVDFFKRFFDRQIYGEGSNNKMRHTNLIF